MNTLILKKPDGTIERFTGEEAAKRMREDMPNLDHMSLQFMYGGTPYQTQRGWYVIEQEGHEFMVADFLTQ